MASPVMCFMDTKENCVSTIELQGTYHLTLSEAVAQGKHRPLRRPPSDAALSDENHEQNEVSVSMQTKSASIRKPARSLAYVLGRLLYYPQLLQLIHETASCFPIRLQKLRVLVEASSTLLSIHS